MILGQSRKTELKRRQLTFSSTTSKISDWDSLWMSDLQKKKKKRASGEGPFRRDKTESTFEPLRKVFFLYFVIQLYGGFIGGHILVTLNLSGTGYLGKLCFI